MRGDATLPGTAREPHPYLLDVVSVQSQVIYGRVGNNVAVPVLQGGGLSVAAVPTVLLSNTPHYSSVHGGAVPAEWLEGYLYDLGRRGALQRLRAVLVGYLGHPDHAAVLARWISRLQQEMPGLLVVVDPVIGDVDVGTYVAPGLVDAYCRYLLPLATGLTPNGYELAQLTGMPTGRQEEAMAAARQLLGARTRWVAVTSAAPAAWPDGQMGTALVTATESVTLRHTRVDCACKGTGDLFAASLTASLLDGIALPDAVSLAGSRVVEVLEQTRAACCNELVLTAGSPLAAGEGIRAASS